MALRYVDSFDMYGSGELAKVWSSTTDSVQIVSSGLHKNGLYVYTSSSFASGVTKALDSQQTWVLGFAIKVNGIGGNAVAPLCSFYDGGILQLGVYREFNGSISVKRGSTTLGTTDIVFPMATWVHMAVKVKIHSSEGAVEVRINGSSAAALKLSGINTQNTSNATANTIAFGAIATGTPQLASIIDNLYILDGTGQVNNDFLGEVSVIAHSPTGDGTSSTWVPSAGTDHYALVDESPGSAADYITGSSGDRDLFTFSPEDLTGFTIKGVVLKALAKKTDSGDAGLLLVAKSGETVLQGAANVLSQDDMYYSQAIEMDPNTNNAWTPESLAAAEFGVEAS
mgnify:CR=1 FL=1